MKSILTGLTLFASLLVQANSATDQSLDSSAAQAKAMKLSYLPQYIEEQRKICGYSGGSEADRENCRLEIVKHADNILSCPRSAKRLAEGVAYDEWLAQESFLKNQKAEVPVEIQESFNKLVEQADKQNGKPFHFKFKLAAYEADVKNAHAAVSGQIYISSGLWTGENKLSILEITAIMAHELTHVIHQHGILLNCMAIEWTGIEYDVREAQQIFREDFGGSDRFNIWSKLSMDLEYDADAGATELLKLAGFEPTLMAQALEKIRPKTTGFTSGSHPDFDVRIRAARKAAARY